MINFSFDEIEEMMFEGGYGFCIVCHEQHGSYCDPDQRKTTCDECGTPTVYGLEELIQMGEINVTD